MGFFSKKRELSNKNKKIGFISAILLVVGSCVGAGIFFKAKYILNNLQQDLVLSIFAWIIAAIAVIAMALALVEICSTSTNSDKGLMEWNKIFNKKWIYFASKNFMTFLYMPITYFFMPVYACQSLLQAINAFGISTINIPWWSILLFSLVINFWFIIVSGKSSRIGNFQNWFLSVFKFIPMIVAAVIGFILLGLNNNELPPIINSNESKLDSWTLPAISPVFGLFTSLSAVFFAYDGFYVASGIQSQMKEPKKTSLALVIGLSLVTFFYLLIAISCMVGSETGAWDGFVNSFKFPAWKYIYGTLCLFLSFGVIGIMNSYAIWTPRFLESLILDDELFSFCQRFKSKINLNKPYVGIKISLFTSIPIVILFTVIGSLGYIDVGGFHDVVNIGVAKLYSFADLSSSWTAVLAFGFISLSILGCLINRKTKKIKTVKSRIFIPAAIISFSLISISLLLEFISPFVNLFSIIALIQKGHLINNDSFISSILVIVVLFLYLTCMLLPIIWDYKLLRYTNNRKWQMNNKFII